MTTKTKIGWALCVGLALLAPSGWTAQDFTADELLENLDNFVKEKNDANAVGVLDLMAANFAKYEESDQKKFAKEAAGCLNKRREEGDDVLYLGALKSMESMGEEGEKTLVKSLKNNNVKKRRAVLGAALISISTFTNVRNIKTLEDFLVNSDPFVVASAATALGAYHEEEEKVRKDIVEQLVKTYANYDALAVSRPKEPIFKENLDQVARPLETSLAKLTGQTISGATDWQKWYNDNKKKRWSPDEEG